MTALESPLFPPFERCAAFDQLAALIRSNRPPIALIGAGASLNSGYPNWHQLLVRLQETASPKARALQWRTVLADLNDAPWTAEVFVNGMAPRDFRTLIRTEFKEKSDVREPHLSLARMNFSHYITTNYDPCIEMALKAAERSAKSVAWHNPAMVSDFLINLGNRRPDTYVVYLHGRHDDDPENIILTESSYVERYVASDDARRKLMAIFLTHPVVFVGFSMNDPDLGNIMREVTARLRTTPPCHFALMGYRNETERDAIRARMVGKFGVSPIFYSHASSHPSGDEHCNLVHLLDALAGNEQPREPSAMKPSKALPEFDPEDPHKGRFGETSERNGRRLSVASFEINDDETLDITLRVDASADAANRPLAGPVSFHLHPTFPRQVVTHRAKKGVADCVIEAYGAFTIGVEVIDEKLKLELDLATQPELPMWFRRR